MNISSITYSNYAPGLIYNTESKSVDTDPFAKQEYKSHPVVNQGIAQQVSQTSETRNTPSQEDTSDSKNPAVSTNPDTATPVGQALTREEIQLLLELKQIDTKVRQHEMAHIAVGGRYITSGATFTFKRGPDGRNYAVGGEVGIDTSPIPGDPRATVQKMRQIKSAALAPADPSSQDLKVASQATSNASKALSDLMILQAKEQADSNGNKAFGNIEKAAQSYEKINNLPQDAGPSFQIAV